MLNTISLHRPRLATVNRWLLVAIILINSYVIATPFLPKLGYWWGEHVHHTSEQLKKVVGTGSPASTPAAVPQDNRLIVPSMQLDAPIHEGASAAVLSKGIWHRPATSTPDKGSNTVLAGHRFTYTEPKGIFYYLDKVTIGEKIALYWHGTKYVYKVNSIRVVPPTAIEVEAPTDDSRLTLYTCTPLWSPKERLVVVASLESKT